MPWEVAKHQGKVERWRGKWRVYLPRVGYLYNHRGVPFTSEANAQAVLDAFRIRAYQEGLELAAEEFKPPKRSEHTVEKWSARFLEEYRRQAKLGTRSYNSLRNVELCVRGWRILNGRTVLELEARHILELERSLEEAGLHPNTVSHSLRVFHRLLTFAEERLPQRFRFRPPRFPRREHVDPMPAVPTLETRDRIIAAIPEDRRGIFLAMRLALRPGEARAINTDQYDRAGRTLRVERAMQGTAASAPRRSTKEKSWRVVEVDQELADWIEAHVPRELGVRPLFQHPDGNTADKRWAHCALTKEWKRACERAGFAPIALYIGTKHATLSHMVRTGSTLYEAQKAAGHRSSRSTELYAKLEAVSPALSFKRKR